MKSKLATTLLVGAGLCGALWAISGPASAHERMGFDISVGVPAPYYAPPPIVYAPPPVYLAPRPVYYPGYYQADYYHRDWRWRHEHERRWERERGWEHRPGWDHRR